MSEYEMNKKRDIEWYKKNNKELKKVLNLLTYELWVRGLNWVRTGGLKYNNLEIRIIDEPKAKDWTQKF